MVYEPKVKYYVGQKQPPRIKNGFFAWLPPLLHTKEPELLEKIGLDAVTYLRFLRMLRWLFTAIAALTVVVLVPINISYNLRHNVKNATILTMMTVQDVRGDLLFVHVAVMYIITIIVLGFAWYHWKAIIRLRHQWFRSDEYKKSFYARTLMVLKVPKKLQSDAGLQSLFDSLRVPYPTTAVHIGRRVGQLPELVELHNQAVKDLEQVLVTYLKDGTVGKKRPTITDGGFLGIGGKKVDAINFYTNRIRNIEAAVEDSRSKIDLKKAESYGFASMASVAYAHTVAKVVHQKKKKGAVITLAPNPKDIIWKNLVKSDASRARDRTIGFLLLCLVCFFNTIPLTIISFLANLTYVQAYVPLLQSWSQKSQWTFSVVSGVLPPAISAFFGFFLPKIMRRLSKYQGDLTRSRLDRAVIARYYGFLIISQLFIFTIIGVAYQSVSLIILEIGQHKTFAEIIKNVSKLPGQIQNTYIQQSAYWLTFFPLRGFLAFFDLAQLLNLVWITLKTRMFGRTPRDIREWTQPQVFEFAIYYSSLLFMGAVAFVYAPLAPLVAVMAAVVFWITSITSKYQLMFVFISKAESGGRLWNVAINRLLFSTIFMHLMMTLTIGLVHGWRSYLWVACIPPMFMVAFFKVWSLKVFNEEFRWYIPTEQELAENKLTSERERNDNKGGRLSKRFGHPALHADLFTPMVHAKMVHLLPQVYSGRLSQEETGLQEFGGEKASAAVVSGGLKIAGIEQSDLEYDPALYQRDRGEQDWDARSINSNMLLGDAGPAGAPGHTPRMRSADLKGYMERGPGSHIELNRLDYTGTTDSLPLLQPDPQIQHPPQHIRHSSTFDSMGTSASGRMTPTQPLPAPHSNDRFRTAPLHRPGPPSRVSSEGPPFNMAGRGARGRQW
ncbi:uncharacterized protein EI90DRAFT_2964439 [Cantharellus anzutake]|uniref:uncharacterized protein n=1 Tax=Cantharellus anzutake TaxID=1750568 RepID=UPI001903BD68|nr:uncharacterized protein EI90DRAFT_2964439 [Cantharellus anzutake]KAF8342679.1 hypothetical protein EI90DRAFT_2964439 [Cantharellus anzutake]